MNSRIARFSALLLLAPAVAAASTDRVADASSGKNPDPGDMVLFPMDDVSIPWRDNVKLTLQRPEKYSGNPVMQAGPVEGPDGYGPLLYGTVIKQEGKFRMWYIAWPRPDVRIPGDVQRLKTLRPVAYAESTDGIHWERPNLGLVEFRGSRNNNLVGIEPANAGYAAAYDFVAVLYDPADPDPGRRYKMAYITYVTKGVPHTTATTATAVSPDGLRWRLANTTMFTKGHFENTSLVKFDGLYYLAGQNVSVMQPDGALPDGSPGGRVMKVFFSPDFLHWSNGRALAFYRSDYVPEPTPRGRETHMGAGLWNRGNVILGFYGRWYGNTIIAHPEATRSIVTGLQIDLGLVISNDAIHYREPVRNFVMVPHGSSQDWDREAVLQANAFANTGTETLMWYSGWKTSAPETIPLPELQPAAEGVGLLRLPRDRFGCFTKLVDAWPEGKPAHDVKRDASCLTRRLRLSRPSRLFVNLDGVSPGAALQIALVDDAEQPLPGYTAQLDESSLKSEVLWAGGQRALPTNTPFRIKAIWPVGVDRAQLYAFYIEHE